jgi:hypothetical protein
MIHCLLLAIYKLLASFLFCSLRTSTTKTISTVNTYDVERCFFCYLSNILRHSRSYFIIVELWYTITWPFLILKVIQQLPSNRSQVEEKPQLMFLLFVRRIKNRSEPTGMSIQEIYSHGVNTEQPILICKCFDFSRKKQLLSDIKKENSRG